MMKTTLISFAVLMAVTCGAAMPEKSPAVYEASTTPKPAGQIDKIVFAKLDSMGVKPVLCSDAVFVRRAYLDIIGKIPTAAEAREFIEDQSAQKRKVLIDELMERDEFADYWSMKWGDVLRIKAEFPINLWPNAAQAYHRWVHASIAANKPYDKFVREMLASSGSNFRVGPVNFYRALQNKTPEGIATAVALTFMGARVEAWPKDRLAGMMVFFSQVGYKPTNEWKEESVFWDPLKTTTVPGNAAPGEASIAAVISSNVKQEPAALPPVTRYQTAVFPDGKEIKLSGDRDPRHIFADWLITEKNPWFTRSIANRVWAWLLGRGIIHEPDDIRNDNRPSNPKLLTSLQEELISSDYDLSYVYKLILNSTTYQLSSASHFDDPEAVANFGVYPVRRLDAEVLIDAINQVTGTTDLYTSAIPEPFTYIPKDMPAVAIADGSITSPFLALFGRSARATGTADERNNNPVPAQSLHMLNSGHIQGKLEKSPKLTAIITSKRKAKETVDELYLTILSRYPTDQEMKSVMEYGKFDAREKAESAARSANAKRKPKPKRWAQMTAPERAAARAARVRIAQMTPAQKEAEKKKKAAEARKARVRARQKAEERKRVMQGMRSRWNDIAWMLINSQEFLYRH